jgi:hypothetical protein
MIESNQPRRKLLLGLGTLGAAALASCSQRGADRPSAVATLANHDKIVEAIGDLSTAVESLEQSVSGFEDENWRDVVPEVESATASVSGALDTLKGLMAGSGAG